MKLKTRKTGIGKQESELGNRNSENRNSENQTLGIVIDLTSSKRIQNIELESEINWTS
jgi:hypothetical protein